MAFLKSSKQALYYGTTDLALQGTEINGELLLLYIRYRELVARDHLLFISCDRVQPPLTLNGLVHT